MTISMEDMKGCIQEWLAQARSFEDLRDIYYVIRAEADLQFNIMADIIAKEFDN